MFAMHDGRLIDGSSVLPESWMAASTTASSANDRYGLLWWLRPNHAFAAVGIYGQAIYVNPPCRLVVVTHSAWPRATDREFAAHREAFFAEMARWAAGQDGGSCMTRSGNAPQSHPDRSPPSALLRRPEPFRSVLRMTKRVRDPAPERTPPPAAITQPGKSVIPWHLLS